jgi:hypothetical protein
MMQSGATTVAGSARLATSVAILFSSVGRWSGLVMGSDGLPSCHAAVSWDAATRRLLDEGNQIVA